MNTFNFSKIAVVKKIKQIINIIILILSGLMTVCGQMPALDPVTFEYIGEYLFWKNPLAIYWYVLLPSAAIALAHNEPDFYKSYEKIFDIILLLLILLTLFAATYHYLKYF